MSTPKKLPTRRDRREAEGYLDDLLDGIQYETGLTSSAIAGRLLDAGHSVTLCAPCMKNTVSCFTWTRLPAP